MKCPKCNSKSIGKIFWGIPNVELIREQIEKKEIILGGHIISNHNPKWECNLCNHRWGEI